MAEAWLNSPCTDPFGRVFARDGRILRALFPGSSKDALRTLEDPAVQGLMREGLVARTWRSELALEGFGPVLESERAPFDVPCDRFSFGALRQAALDWLEITRRLLPSGLALTDAHYGNFMLFGANRPRWIDLGSIRSAALLPAETPFKAFRMFWQGMLAPLTVLAAKPRHARLARLAIADHPLQGPRVASNEPPAAVDFLLEPPALRATSAEDALREAAALVPASPAASSLPINQLEESLVARVRAALQGADSVACAGAETYLALSGAFEGKDVLVIEPDEARMAQVARALGEGMRPRNVALYQQHCINRLLRRSPPRAQAVLCLDPARALAHDSHVAAANIDETLSAIAERIVVAVSPRGLLGGWDVLVRPKA